MTRGIDNSELIDRFLRDEMRGEERDVFLRRMETDPAFQLEVESQKLLAEAIRLARKNELKRYIAEHTQTRSARLRPALVWSLSAAASIAALAVFWFTWQRYDGSREHFARQDVRQEASQPAPAATETERLQRDRAIARTTPSSAQAEVPLAVNEPPPVQQEDIDANVSVEESIGVSAGTPVAPSSEKEDANQRYVVATIIVAVADYNMAAKDEAETEFLSRQDVVVTKRVRPVGKESNRATKAQPATSQPATEQDDAVNRKPVTVDRNAAQSNYTLVFINSKDGVQKAQAESGKRILLYNLPYNNPMLIALGGKHYLGTAGLFYALQPELPTPQMLTPEKDAALLKTLQGE